MKVTFSIDRLEGEKAVLKDADNNTIVWPRTKLPEEFQEGQNVLFDITGGEKKDQTEAKDILNDILDIE